MITTNNFFCGATAQLEHTLPRCWGYKITHIKDTDSLGKSDQLVAVGANDSKEEKEEEEQTNTIP